MSGVYVTLVRHNASNLTANPTKSNVSLGMALSATPLVALYSATDMDSVHTAEKIAEMNRTENCRLNRCNVLCDAPINDYKCDLGAGKLSLRLFRRT